MLFSNDYGGVILNHDHGDVILDKTITTPLFLIMIMAVLFTIK